MRGNPKQKLSAQAGVLQRQDGAITIPKELLKARHYGEEEHFRIPRTRIDQMAGTSHEYDSVLEATLGRL